MSHKVGPRLTKVIPEPPGLTNIPRKTSNFTTSRSLIGLSL